MLTNKCEVQVPTPPPRLCLITNGKRSEVLLTLNLIKERKTRNYEFRRDKIAIFLLIPQKKSSQNLGDILESVSHFFALIYRFGFPLSDIRTLCRKRKSGGWNWLRNGSGVGDW